MVNCRSQITEQMGTLRGDGWDHQRCSQRSAFEEGNASVGIMMVVSRTMRQASALSRRHREQAKHGSKSQYQGDHAFEGLTRVGRGGSLGPKSVGLARVDQDVIGWPKSETTMDHGRTKGVSRPKVDQD